MGPAGKAIVIAGPTASGKSALAVDIAERLDGTIINADSMQVYRDLRILTARPPPADEARAPHRLYGVLDAAEDCSAGRWRAMAEAEIRAAWAAGRLPLIVGGTGLYIRAIMEGLAPTPEVPAAVRRAARDLQRSIGTAALFERLVAADPRTAAGLDPANTQRVLRAWEVLQATGRPLADWQAEPPAGRLEAEWLVVTVLPPREALYAACERRVEAMLAAGALEEVRALLARGLDPALPAMKALGVPELAAHVRGETGREAAVAALQQATRRYAKRQLTWLRHQLTSNVKVSAQYSESLRAQVLPFIRAFVLTGESGPSSLGAPRAGKNPRRDGD